LSSSELFEEVKILINNIVWQNKRLILLLSSTGEERYLNFIQTYPMLYERLPLKMIASYIGVTPEHLSSIRKQLSSK
jgi:sulfopyruvate decarboxylase TPP-binding subunit